MELGLAQNLLECIYYKRAPAAAAKERTGAVGVRDAHIALESTDGAEPAVNLKSIFWVSTVALVGHSISCLSGAPYKIREKSAAPARGKVGVEGSHIDISLFHWVGRGVAVKSIHSVCVGRLSR